MSWSRWKCSECSEYKDEYEMQDIDWPDKLLKCQDCYSKLINKGWREESCMGFCTCCNIALELKEFERASNEDTNKCNDCYQCEIEGRVYGTHHPRLHLYILSFNDEDLIKIGCSSNIFARVRALGVDRFDLENSYSTCLFRSRSSAWRIEKSLKSAFSRFQKVANNRLCSANTETFSSAALGPMLNFISTFNFRWPDSNAQIKRDLSSLFEQEVANALAT
jgi:T5orf172 domain